MTSPGDRSAYELREGESFGGWTIVRPLASGGMGSVYAARNQVTGALRALKVIKRDLLSSDDIRTRFVREVSLASRVRHPHVVEAYDPLVIEGRVVLPMELLEGETLAERLGRGPLQIGEAVQIALALARAVTAFHALGIIHRDLKPANVFLARGPSGETVPKVLDLGAARELSGAKHTQTGHTIGSPSYMAPEQARGETNLDVRVDVYGLGALTYVMLTRKRPVESDAEGSAIAKLVSGAPIVPPSRHRPEISAPLEHAVLTALARERSARFASADAFATALTSAEASARAIPSTRAMAVRPAGTMLEELPTTVVPPRPERRGVPLTLLWIGAATITVSILAISVAGLIYRSSRASDVAPTTRAHEPTVATTPPALTAPPSGATAPLASDTAPALAPSTRRPSSQEPSAQAPPPAPEQHASEQPAPDEHAQDAHDDAPARERISRDLADPWSAEPTTAPREEPRTRRPPRRREGSGGGLWLEDEGAEGTEP
ncbi:MAG: serine/threonine protein kinase [Sandaracinaceae bacterium]|nr:serine/threonine protein kinase [Sandaracinaceae bacterium]